MHISISSLIHSALKSGDNASEGYSLRQALDKGSLSKIYVNLSS